MGNQPSVLAASCKAPTALLVDCGSGRTRAKVFIPKGEGVTQVEAGKYCSLPEWQETAIVATLKGGSSAVRNWVESLRKLVQSCRCDKVIVGATGGLRNAVSNKEVSAEMLDDLRKTLKDSIPDVIFKELSEAQEAAAELSAVQYVASLALPSGAPQPVSVISGGGMTCQVAYYLDAESSPRFESIEANMKSTSDKMVNEASAEAALAEFDARLAGLVSRTGLSAKLKGTICVIEMLGYLGESKSQFPELAALKLSNRLLKKADVVQALQAHLRDWMGRNQRISESGDVSAYDVAYTGLLPKCLLGLLDLVDDNATLYLCRLWAVGPDTKIKPDWSLGVYIDESKALEITKNVEDRAVASACAGTSGMDPVKAQRAVELAQDVPARPRESRDVRSFSCWLVVGILSLFVMAAVKQYGPPMSHVCGALERKHQCVTSWKLELRTFPSENHDANANECTTLCSHEGVDGCCEYQEHSRKCLVAPGAEVTTPGLLASLLAFFQSTHDWAAICTDRSDTLGHVLASFFTRW